jgi:hypothetical protein
MEFFITNPEEKWTTAKLKLINKELVPYLFPNIDIPTYFDSHPERLDTESIPTFNRFGLRYNTRFNIFLCTISRPVSRSSSQL